MVSTNVGVELTQYAHHTTDVITRTECIPTGLVSAWDVLDDLDATAAMLAPFYHNSLGIQKNRRAVCDKQVAESAYEERRTIARVVFPDGWWIGGRAAYQSVV